jgi:type I restriction enzyme S subunit
VRLLPKDTLLIAMYGQGQTRGRTGLLACEATTNQACFAAAEIGDFVTGSAQPKLSQGSLNGIPVPTPSLDIQREICGQLAAELSGVRTLRGHLTQKLATIDKIPASLLREAFSGLV